MRQLIQVGCDSATVVRVQEQAMTPITPPARPGSDKLGPLEKSGPEKYAPPDRRGPEKLSNVDKAAASAFEREIRDSAQPRQPDNEAEPVADPGIDNLNALIRRVSGASMDEIDRVIHELESVRTMLRNEGERVSREIAGYGSLSHAAITAMKIVTDSLTQWKSPTDK